MSAETNPWSLLGIENNMALAKSKQRVMAEIINNLYYLLNTRKATVPQAYLAPGQTCVFGFGLEDLSRFNPESTQHSAELCQILKTAITQYEPRLKQISIELKKEKATVYYELVFRISAVLNLEATELVQLESVLSLKQLSFSLRELE
jgi:type VI secretion system lysozyme-like protein